MQRVRGVSRVCGEISLSRALGDIKYKLAGVVSAEADVVVRDIDAADRFVLLACERSAPAYYGRGVLLSASPVWQV